MNAGSKATATDQGESGADLAIAKGIRPSLEGTVDFSTRAKIVTVGSKDGVVGPRGSVPSADEKSRIESIAHDAAGVGRVDIQLTIQ